MTFVSGAVQDFDVYSAMDGWLHCFRNPDAVLPKGVPRILLSESDFYNPMQKGRKLNISHFV